HGTTIPDPCPECSGQGRVRSRRSLPVSVPAGVETGNRMKLTGSGEVGPGGGPAGDLYVEIRVNQHEVFARRGDDLHARVEVPMTAAALGTRLNLETFDGEQEIDIDPGTEPEQIIALRGLGVGHLNGSGRGDLNGHVDVQGPAALDDRQREILTELAT